MAKVSIIVTTYNVENYIRESLASVMAQTLDDIEIIVVDDGSTDATPKIVSDLSAGDPRIRTILFENNTVGGVASAANAGIEAATGDFIGFADGDDLYDSTMFEKLWRAATEQEADLAICHYTLLDESDGSEKKPAEEAHWKPFLGKRVVDLDEKTRRQMLRLISVPWRKLYRRDLIEKNDLRFPVGDYFYEDNPFHWGAVIDASRVALIHEELCKHRVARPGQTMATADERLLRIFLHHDNIRDALKKAGALETYRMDLLRWVGAQLSWVSERTEGKLRRQLFDRITPIVAQYDDHALDTFVDLNGRNRATRMLLAAKKGDFRAFSNAAGWISAPKRMLANLTRNVKWLAGLVVGQVLGLFRRKRNVFSSEDLMAAMVVLQADLRRVRDELEMLRQAQSKSGEGDEGPENRG